MGISYYTINEKVSKTRIHCFSSIIVPIQIIIKMGCGLNYGVIAGRIPKIDIGNWIILIHDIFIAQLCQAVSRAVLRSSGILIGIIESICSILLDSAIS